MPLNLILLFSKDYKGRLINKIIDSNINDLLNLLNEYCYKLIVDIITKMIRLITRHVLHFTKITPQVYPQIKTQFEKQPLLKSLGQYFTNENKETLFNLVIESRITPVQSNSALESLLELCGTENDEQLNLIVNVLKQKAINNTRVGDLSGAISQFQQAISTILLMQNPDDLVLSQIYKFIGDLYIQIGDLKKAQKSLRDSQNLLKNLKFSNQQDEKYLHSGLACIYTQICMIYYRQKRPIQAFEILQKALDEWQLVPIKFLQEYELSCRLKCMLHVLFKQQAQAVNTAKHYLSFLIESPQYIKASSKKKFMFSKLYYLNILCSYGSEYKEEQKQVMDILNTFKKEKGEQKMMELMVMVGIKPNRYQL